jgi:hypothetical protein
MEAPQKIVYILPFQWLHEICLLKRLPLHFWPGLIPLATITLPIHSARRSRVPTIGGFVSLRQSSFPSIQGKEGDGAGPIFNCCLVSSRP